MLSMKHLMHGMIYTGILAIVILFHSLSHGATIYVGPNENFKTIQEGVSAAARGDTVIVKDGVYRGTGNRKIHFMQKKITIRSENGPNNCIIELDKYAGFTYDFTDKTNYDYPPQGSRISGFSIKNGISAILVENWYINGGYGPYPTITVDNCIITNCYQGISVDSIGVEIKKCIIRDSGTGIYYNSSYSENDLFSKISDCIITNNNIGVTNEWSDGPTGFISNTLIAENKIGGIEVSDFEVNNCTIIANGFTKDVYDSSDIGGIRVYKSTIAGSYIANNMGIFGGVFLGGSSKILTSNIINNIGITGGGIYCGEDSSNLVDSCNVSNNNPSGVASGSEKNIVRNCLISSNSRGGINLQGSNSTSIVNCTIAGNKSSGVYAYDPGFISLANSIIWGHTYSFDITGGSGFATIDARYCDIQETPGFSGVYPGRGNIAADPKFSSIALKDYHLGASSPCINKGSNSALNLSATDKDGLPRIADSVVDMGAYEYTSNPYLMLPLVSIMASDSIADESGDVAIFRISRTGDTSLPLVVKYYVTGTAKNSIDYPKLAGSVKIAAGKSYARIFVKPYADNLAENDETIKLLLIPYKGYDITSPSAASAKIVW